MEPLNADESARGAAFDALLLDLFGEVSPADACSSTTPTIAPVDASDDAFVDFQTDLAAFDALMESPQSGLVFDIAVSLDTEPPPVKHESTVNNECGAEAGNARCSTGVHTASNSAAPAVKNKCAPGGNTARKRHREELRALRKSVVVLEQELWGLRTKASEASPLPHNSSSGGGGRHGFDTLSPDQKAPRRWPPQGHQQGLKVHFPPKPPTPKPSRETLLANETHARQITELENIHLSKLVKDHEKVAQQFEKALRRETPPSVSK